MKRRLLAISTALAVALALYAIPLLLELALLRTHVSVWLTCVILADLPGAIVVYALGFRKIAIGTYTAATLLEAALLFHGLMPYQIIWLTNIAPTLAAGVIVFIMADFSLTTNNDLSS
jgi:hypothetical protein